MNVKLRQGGGGGGGEEWILNLPNLLEVLFFPLQAFQIMPKVPLGICQSP